MINRKSLSIFLLTAFLIAWFLFLLPLAFGAPGSTGHGGVALAAWAVAMWAPGLGAILATRFGDRQPQSTLRLMHTGPWRMYLWAWLLPPLLTIAAGLITVVLGIARPDLEFTAIRDAMANAQGPQMPVAIILVLQSLVALTLGPLFNTLFALGEELGWRGYLLPKLLPMGQMRAILISGVIWGAWHAPAILQGHNYPGQPILGVFLMVGFCVLFGTILSWIYLRARSPWAPALCHGTLNAVAGFPLLFMPKVNMALGGTLSSLVGWIPMLAFIGWLLWSRRLPVDMPVEIEA
jgi:uncharacterized protein